MWFDLSKLAPRDGYKLLSSTVVPRPIAWVVSADKEGRLNAAPFSFFNLFSDDPPIVCLGIMGRAGGPKDTSANIRAREEFVINVVPESLAAKMNMTSGDYAAGIDELACAGLTVAPSTKIGVPRIAESPVALECVPINFMDVGGGRVIIAARVVGVHVADHAVLDAAKCYIDTPALQLVGRMHGGGEYTRTTDRFNMTRPTPDELVTPPPAAKHTA
ncbi:Flavin reductase like domain-containing protein [Bordetella sputigena]|uniref:flavin reductase family protein n=1 Tax=Bordetella sputigena TaxID=1416810 RepID=UPI0039EEB6BB